MGKSPHVHSGNWLDTCSGSYSSAVQLGKAGTVVDGTFVPAAVCQVPVLHYG
jgi:hypothetical protein